MIARNESICIEQCEWRLKYYRIKGRWELLGIKDTQRLFKRLEESCQILFLKGLRSYYSL